jgi:hypothetical protein
MAAPSIREAPGLPGPAADDSDRVLMPVLAGRRLIVVAGSGEDERTALLDRLGRNVDGHGGLGLRVRPGPGSDIDAIIRDAARGVLPGAAQEPDIGVLVEGLERRLDAAGLGLLVVEEAQALPAGMLTDLAELAASTTASGNYLQVLLAGPAELAETVSALEAQTGIRPGAVILIGAPDIEPPAPEPLPSEQPAPQTPILAPVPPAVRPEAGETEEEEEEADGSAQPLPPVPREAGRGRVLGLSALALACVCAFAGGFGAHAVFFAKGDPLDMAQDLRTTSDQSEASTATEAFAGMSASGIAADPVQEAALPPMPDAGGMGDPVEDMGGDPAGMPVAGAPGADAFWTRGPGLGGPGSVEPELFEWGEGMPPAAAPIPRPPPPRPEVSVASAGSGRSATRQRADRQQVAQEDACRRGLGGQTAREASLAGFAEGFLADLRSLGSCIRDGLASD